MKVACEYAAEDLAAAYPVKRRGSAEAVAAVVHWLAGDAASYVSGRVICVDFGNMPQAVADRLLG